MSLILEEISMQHIHSVQKYASDRLISETTASIPHPYPSDGAKQFINDSIKKRVERLSFVFAIEVNEQFVGVCSLFNVSWQTSEAEVGYWIGVPFWNKGYATKAASLLLSQAKDLGLKSLYAKCLVRNPASKNVLEKNGFHFVKDSIGCGRHTNDKVLVYQKSTIDFTP